MSDGLDNIFTPEAIKFAEGNASQLREYWTHGAGAARIRWGTDGDLTRCHRHLRKYVRDPWALCQSYHVYLFGRGNPRD